MLFSKAFTNRPLLSTIVQRSTKHNVPVAIMTRTKASVEVDSSLTNHDDDSIDPKEVFNQIDTNGALKKSSIRFFLFFALLISFFVVGSHQYFAFLQQQQQQNKYVTY